jgi:hypothetical protein
VRRNQTIINLYDRPLYPRPSYSSRHLKPIEYPRPILSYLVVTGALLYCAVYLVSGLSERRPARLETAPAKLERAGAVAILSAPEAPAPDMSSEDVRFAAADAAVSHAHADKAPEPTKIAVKAPQKTKVPIVAKPKEQDGLQAYAFSFAGSRTHDGGGF